MKLKVNNVTKKFKEKTAVDQFSMELRSGECVGLIGPNGAGKTTLLKMIVDMMKPSVGEISLDGKKHSEMKRKIGYLPQYPNFFPWMTALETLVFMGQLSGIKREELVRTIPEMIEKVGLSGENAKVSTFSGGMKQRLGIAQALLHQPSLLVMDEPVSSLDPIGRREVLHILGEIKKETTILLSTHILSDAEELCERFVMIKHGQKIEDTTMMELLGRHSENKIHMVTANENKYWLEVIKGLDYVKDIEFIGNRVKIEVEDMERDKNKILTSALKHNVDIIKFEMARDALEEIFLKMVVE